MHSQDLLFHAHQLAAQERNIQDLAFCFDTYLEFARDGREPTKYTDGTVAMDADGATRQLENAIRRVLGDARRKEED
jgi:hypothetical protein